MKSIDTHLILGNAGTRPSGTPSAHTLLEAMDAHEIEYGWVSHLAGSIHHPDLGNQCLWDALQEVSNHAARLLPVPVADLYQPIHDLAWDEWDAWNVKIVRICPDFYKESATESKLNALQTLLKEHSMSLQVACTPFYGAPWTLCTMPTLTGILEIIQNIPVVVTGVTRSHLYALMNLLRQHKQMIIDVGNLSTGSAIPMLLKAGFSDRLVCGSGFGISEISVFKEMVLYSGIPEEDQQKIVYYTAKQIGTY